VTGVQTCALPISGLTPLTLWPSSEGVWVGGKGAGLALWDGNCLRVQPGQQETIEDLWGGTWAVGRNGLVLHRTDAGWQRIDVGVQTHLRAVWSWAGEDRKSTRLNSSHV